ncbi:HpcH/HpaI aldolase/citrate lyase family protein [Rhodococcus erythropolis]|uniref:HpcH/HpaI aldolase/citrate lyase family protein n=1 Tax=Rhodococcus erythropolis TaxID=1833 RepID=UPI0022267F19|nr:CoA ester lyase [Rhodococcus erythropolis]MCW2295412.1 citrate lyase subunit beta/citryl-CoA lyase [Rhodococcus erythropolis]
MTMPRTDAASQSYAAARTALFVPGNRPERFIKATSSGADCVIVDLEDAVAADDKDKARDHVDNWLARGGVGAIRINSLDTTWARADVEMVRGYDCVVVLPKAHTTDDIAWLHDQLGHRRAIAPLLETPAGILNAAALCAAPGVVRAAFGSVDLGTELGIEPNSHLGMQHARSTVVLSSAAAHIAPPLDGVTTDLQSDARLRADTEHAAALGFTGKLCIHPSQISTVRALLSPTARETDWAQRVVDGAAADRTGALTIDGQMIDRPVVERARRILHERR